MSKLGFCIGVNFKSNLITRTMKLWNYYGFLRSNFKSTHLLCHHFLCRTEMIPSPRFHTRLNSTQHWVQLRFEAKGTGADGNEGDDEMSAENSPSLTLVDEDYGSTETSFVPEALLGSMKPAWEYLDGQLMREWVSPSASIWRNQSEPWFALVLTETHWGICEWVTII